MLTVTVFERHAQEYDQWVDAHAEIYEAEVTALRQVIPAIGRRIEVGIGTGRFAVPLGVKLGIDPSQAMLQLARRRGLSVC